MATSHHNQAHYSNQDHDDEPSCPIPQVQDLSDWHQTRRTHDAGDDRDDGQQRVLRETTCNIGRQIRSQTAVEVIGKVYQPHTIFSLVQLRSKEVRWLFSPSICANQVLLRPRLSDGFSDSNTILLIFIF